MIWVFIVCLALFVFFMQRKLAVNALKHLHYDYSLDKQLVEPNEKVVLSSSVKNTSSMPIMYVGMNEFLSKDLNVHEDEKWMSKHFRSGLFEQNTSYKMFLEPHTKYKTRLHFSIPKRGMYKLGKYYIETGDFLGFKSQIKTANLDRTVVVMPKRYTSPIFLKTLGGFIGDISVRRFILEDPVLTIGFRDYTGREPLKNISWTQTSRMNKVVVKEFDYTVESNVSVILNMDSEDKDSLEVALQMLRTVCEELENMHMPYEFYTNGDVVGPLTKLSFLSEGLGTQHLNLILYGLGRSYVFSEISFSELVNKIIAKHEPNKSYIVVTPKMNADGMNALKKLRDFSYYESCIIYADSNIDIGGKK